MQVPNRLRFDERHVGSLLGRNLIPLVAPGSGRGVPHSLCTSVEFKCPGERREPMSICSGSLMRSSAAVGMTGLSCVH